MHPVNCRLEMIAVPGRSALYKHSTTRLSCQYLPQHAAKAIHIHCCCACHRSAPFAQALVYRANEARMLPGQGIHICTTEVL